MSFLVSYKSTRTSTGSVATGERANSIYSGLANNVSRIGIYVAKTAGQPMAAGDEVTLKFYTPDASFAPSTLIATHHLMLQGVAVQYLANSGGFDYYYAQYTINEPLTPATPYCVSLEPVGANLYCVADYRGSSANPPPYSVLGRVNTIMSWLYSGGAWVQLFAFSGAYNYHLEGEEVPLTENGDPKAMAADNLSDSPLAGANGQSLCVNSAGNIYAIYSKFDLLGNYQLYLARSTNGGATWTEELVPGANSANLFYPSIAVDSQDSVHLVFTADMVNPGSFNTGVYYARRDPVSGWGPVQSIFDNGANIQEFPDLAVDSFDTVHVVWAGSGHGTNTNKQQIMYVSVMGGGVGISVQLTDVVYHQYNPRIAVDSIGNLHVAWASSGGFGSHLAIANHVDYVKRTAGAWGSVIDLTDDWDYQTPHGSLADIVLDDADNPIFVYNCKYLVSSAYPNNTLWTRKYDGALSTPELVPLPYRSTNQGFGVALDRSGNLHIFLTAWDSVNGGVIYRARKTGATWDTFEYLTVLGAAGIANRLSNTLWANYPQVGGVKTNVAITKPLIVWNKSGGATAQLWFWPAPAPAPPAGRSQAHVISAFM